MASTSLAALPSQLAFPGCLRRRSAPSSAAHAPRLPPPAESKPETIPATLVGIHTVIDCATGRPEEPIRTVITLCERLAGQDANVTTVPVAVLRFTRQLTRFFQWTNDVADRLAFSEVLSSDTVFSAPMNETYQLLGVDAKDILSLEKYLQEYFTNILKKLKGLKAQSKQTDIFF